jgi:threonine synthase
MRFRSTTGKSGEVSLREAVLRGLAEDGGLYVPVEIPRLCAELLERMHTLALPEVCLEVGRQFLEDDVDEEVLRKISAEAFDFPAPLVALSETVYVLELFHGPTLAFKDFGARFMARLMGHFVRELGRELHVLVATSGDTGSAVAQGFLGVPGIRVVILYPSGRVTEAQEKQFTTLGQNVTAVEVSGTFDDCQSLAKRAFADRELREKIVLTSANSINIARLIPQMFYFFWAFAQLPERATPAVFAVPCGNFGNLTAGLMGQRMGLPVRQFIAVTNVNDVVPEYLRSGKFLPRRSQQTISNAMDVGNPSNFSRMLDLYENDLQAMRRDVWSRGFTDEDTLQSMREIYQRHLYVVDPHTALAMLGWRRFADEHAEGSLGVVLATAHPAKFAATIEPAIGVRVELPARLAAALSHPKRSVPMANSLADLKKFLLN